RLADFTPSGRAAMAAYNAADTHQCFHLFCKMWPHFSAKELWHSDAKIRALVEPQLELDVPLLEEALAKERANKRAVLLDLAKMLRYQGMPVGEIEGTDEDYLAEQVRATLASAP